MKNIKAPWEHDVCHEWLVNKYFNRLGGCIERIKWKGDISRITRFVTEDFPEWEEKREVIREVLACFENKQAQQALELANCQYVVLKKAIDFLEQMDLETLTPLLPFFVAFKEACKRLRQAMSSP